jgi:hypothetical protein
MSSFPRKPTPTTINHYLDRAALRRWTAQRHDGYTTARDGAREHGKGWRDGYTAARDGAAFVRGESDLSSFRTMIRDNQTRHELLIRAASPIFSQKENHKNEL